MSEPPPVLLGRPSALCDEPVVHGGVRNCPHDVGGASLGQTGGEGALCGKRPCYPPLVVVATPLLTLIDVSDFWI
jgi:hypothetical protein